jgi:hypothetical protein
MTRRQSMRAQAQEIYRERIAAQSPSSHSDREPALPNPPPQGAREQAAAGGGEQQDLTARVRALYENSAVPVREIAALAGVTERTLYKYAQKGGRKPRYAWIDPGGFAHRRWQAKAQSKATFAPGNSTLARGAGGRFIARADKGKPFARGLKATDRPGAARATAACAGAETIAAQALAEAAWLRWNEVFLSWLKTAVPLRDELATYRARRRVRRGEASTRIACSMKFSCVEFSSGLAIRGSGWPKYRRRLSFTRMRGVPDAPPRPAPA